jgi:hypothetical protein
MIHARLSRSVLLLSSIVAAACGGGDARCVRGTTQECVCAGGARGAQVCDDLGGFGACDCLGSDGGTARSDGARPDGSMVGSGATVTVMVGPSGGSVEVGGATLMIPSGALSSETSITITETTEATPEGYEAYSPLYRFEPEGLVFAVPLTITLAYVGDRGLATLFWSRREGSGYERLGGVPTSDDVAGEVSHFSTGFIANGVDYAEPPDRRCTQTRVLETREVDPSGVALFFAIDDCEGRPITGLAGADLESGAIEVLEDGAPISVEAVPTLLGRDGLEVFVTLLLDLSGSTMPVLADVIDAAQAFVRGVEDRDIPVRIAIRIFAGEAAVAAWQPFTSDTALVTARLEALTGHVPADSSSTNLNGALVAALGDSDAAQRSFRERNQGGAFSAGYVILFTDGADTAGIVSTTDAEAAVRASADEVLAVGLDQSRDYDPAVLERFSPLGTIHSPDPLTLDREFQRLAARIAGQVSRTYLLGYCSPKRSGAHTAGVRLAESTESRVSGEPATFQADGFSGSCTTAVFACGAADDCAGLGCGSCADETQICEGRSKQCVSHCATALLCGGETFTNPLGFAQTCTDDAEVSSCSGECRALESDPRHCGGCDRACSAATPWCRSGICGTLAEVTIAYPPVVPTCGARQGLIADRLTLRDRCVTAYPAVVTPPAGGFGIVAASDDGRVVAVRTASGVEGDVVLDDFLYVAGESALRDMPGLVLDVSANGRTVLLESGLAHHVASGTTTDGNGYGQVLSSDGSTAIVHPRTGSATSEMVRWDVSSHRGTGGEVVCTYPSVAYEQCGLIGISPDGQTLLFNEESRWRRVGPSGEQTFPKPVFPAENIGTYYAADARYVVFDVTINHPSGPALEPPLGSEVRFLDLATGIVGPVVHVDYADGQVVGVTALSSDGSRARYVISSGLGTDTRSEEWRQVELP